MGMETLVAFAIIAGIIFAGFFGEILFKRLGIPSVLLLFAVGYMLGPVMHQLDTDMLQNIDYIVGPLALVILLFEGGMDLNIYRLVHESGRGVLMAILVTVLSMLVTGVIWVALGHSFMMGAVLGAIVGGTTSSMVTSIAGGIKVSEKARQCLIIESALTDVLTVIITIAVMGIIITGNASVQGTGKEILGNFAIGALIGGFLGLAWIALSRRLRSINFFYMLTMAVLLFGYILSEYFGGSGAISALVMGIMLGNYKEIAKMLRINGIDEGSDLFAFQREVGFLVRTFYFVYMGSLIVIGGTAAFLLSLAIMAGLILARWVSTQIATFRSDLSGHKSYINVMMPRGLATAVMSGYPALVLYENRDSIAADVYNSLSSQAGMFVEISFFVIVVSVILTSIGLLFVKRGDAARDRKARETSEEVERRAAARKEEADGGEDEGGQDAGSGGQDIESGPDSQEEGETFGRENKEGAKKQKGR